MRNLGVTGATFVESSSANISYLLEGVRNGDEAPLHQLVPLIYEELRRQARRSLAREREAQSLQASDLVHDAWLRLAGQHDKNWENRVHFYACSAQIMRRILVDRARKRNADRRGGGRVRIELEDGLTLVGANPEEILLLHDALDRLSEIDPRQSRIVELRFFGGLSNEEIASLLSTSTRTIKREWSMARAWLHARVRRGN